jgi:hypothetical protein
MTNAWKKCRLKDNGIIFVQQDVVSLNLFLVRSALQQRRYGETLSQCSPFGPQTKRPDDEHRDPMISNKGNKNSGNSDEEHNKRDILHGGLSKGQVSSVRGRRS